MGWLSYQPSSGGGGGGDCPPVPGFWTHAQFESDAWTVEDADMTEGDYIAAPDGAEVIFVTAPSAVNGLVLPSISDLVLGDQRLVVVPDLDGMDDSTGIYISAPSPDTFDTGGNFAYLSVPSAALFVVFDNGVDFQWRHRTISPYLF